MSPLRTTTLVTNPGVPDRRYTNSAPDGHPHGAGAIVGLGGRARRALRRRAGRFWVALLVFVLLLPLLVTAMLDGR